MPTILNPYLIFNGNCKEAMQFYKDCFGGELTVQTVAESPMAGQLPPQLQEAVMHSQLISGSIIIMASDMNREKLNDGNGSQLCVQCSSEREIKHFFKTGEHLAKPTFAERIDACRTHLEKSI